MNEQVSQTGKTSPVRPRRKRLGGRLEKKHQARVKSSSDWKEEAFRLLIFIYMRFSTREQREKSAYSYQRQEQLKQLAILHGATAELSPQRIEQIRASADYTGWYRDGQIIVEERDLAGVSGTKGQEDRPGLAHLIDRIGQGVISAVYVVDVTRLFRDEYLINATQFAKLCAEHNVFVVTETAVFDLTDDMQRDMFIAQAQYASRELKMILERLGRARQRKSFQGRYAGDAVPIGYVVLRDEASKRLEDYAAYEPHVKLINIIFAKMLELQRIQAVARWCNQNSLLIPAFEPEWDYMNTRSSVRCMKAVHGPTGQVLGYRILRSTVRHVLQNPMYIGQLYREGNLIKEDPSLAIVDEEVFWAVQDLLEQNLPRSREGSHSPFLAGMLYCAAHDHPSIVYGSAREYHCSYEQCMGLTQRRCFMIAKEVLDVPVTEAVLGALSYSEHAGHIVAQIETELQERRDRARAFREEQERLESERDSLIESLAFLHRREKDPSRRQNLMEEIYRQIHKRETQLEQLAQQELAPFQDVLATTEVAMVREFLADLGTRWEEIPVDLRNNFLRVILDRILVEEKDQRFDVQIIWRSGFDQKLVVFRPAGSRRKASWSEQEETTIREHYATASPEELTGMLPGRPWHEIRRRAQKLGVQRGWSDRTGTPNPHWTPDEDQVLRDYDECQIAYSEMLEALDSRTPAAIQRRANILDIDLKKTRIVWRFVDSFDEPARCRGVPFAARTRAPELAYDTRAR